MLTTRSDVRIVVFLLDLFWKREGSLLSMVDVVVCKKLVNLFLCRVLDIILHKQYMYWLFYARNPSAKKFINFFIMSYLPRSTPSVCSTVLRGAPA